MSENNETQPESLTDFNTNKSDSVRTATTVTSKKNMVVEKKRPKKNCRCQTVARPHESCHDVFSSERANEIAQAVYPGVNCGHRDCIRYPVVTPKTMGWLWSLKETGGVKINRNWRPGAIPKNVAVIMEKVRAGEAMTNKRNLEETIRRRRITSNASEMSMAATAASSTGGRSRGPVVVNAAKSQPREKPRRGDVDNEGEPVLALNKHRGQYGIRMNAMPNKDEYGRPVEPVKIKLQRTRGAAVAGFSSMSSVDIELVQPNNGLAVASR